MAEPTSAFEAGLAIANGFDRAGIRSCGASIDLARARADAEAQGMAVAHLGPFRIDVFVPSIPFSWEAQRTRVCERVDARPVYFLSAEALAVFKLLFFRSKDLVDLERLVATLGESLDEAYVRRWMVEMMGEDDERVRAWDRIIAELAPP